MQYPDVSLLKSFVYIRLDLLSRPLPIERSRKVHLRTILTTLSLLCAVAASASAATFSYYDYGPEIGDPDPVEYIRIRGQIRPGDATGLQSLILSDPRRARRAIGVMLESPGGSVIEAMKIGRVVRSMFYSAHAGGFGATAGPNSTCASACFLIYIAAVKREAFPGTLGIHRIYIRDNDSNRSAVEVSKAMRDANRTLREYVEEMDIPFKYIDRMRSSSSVEIDWMSKQDILDLGLLTPFWEEVLIKKCGYNKETQNRLFMATHDDEVRRLIAQMSEFWQCYGRITSLERAAGIVKLSTLELR